jgi:hypothetical protein
MEPWYKVTTPRPEVREECSFNPNAFAWALEKGRNKILAPTSCVSRMRFLLSTPKRVKRSDYWTRCSWQCQDNARRFQNDRSRTAQPN